MIKEIAVSYSETHPKFGKYSSANFFASEKYTINVETSQQYEEEFTKAFNRVQAIVDSQVENAIQEKRVTHIFEDPRD